ncbi:hypothetical protein EYF80_052446 [Liparis tanakae]|uniref:Uncharacterized protein n=1 Tax=Liparis tanakae TaxID=230148 RepID=A0A4Z2F8B1_9TELE|nr:hypothetical protein EYF80_052446 [Liparis tanakae]
MVTESDESPGTRTQTKWISVWTRSLACPLLVSSSAPADGAGRICCWLIAISGARGTLSADRSRCSSGVRRDEVGVLNASAIVSMAAFMPKSFWRRRASVKPTSITWFTARFLPVVRSSASVFHLEQCVSPFL